MIRLPYVGQRVQVWYRKECRRWPFHGLYVTVVVTGRGKPRVHLVRTDDGRLTTVPAGNLR